MAKTIWYLSPIELYLIIRIRIIRLELGVTAKEISLFLKKNPKYIGHIESSAHNAKYSDEILSRVALYLTERAKTKQKELIKANDNTIIQTEYTIHDFYPTKVLGDEKVVKKIDPIPPGSGPTVTLNALIESTNFFEKARTVNEIVTECNALQNQNWKANSFSQPLASAVKRKQLVIILENDLNTYIKPKKRK